MTDLRQAATQALDALDSDNPDIQLRAAISLRTALEQQQAEPPPEWPLIKNILDEYGLDAIAFVADWKAAQRPWVGLEIEEVQDSYNSNYQAQTRAVEKLLKERNT